VFFILSNGSTTKSNASNLEVVTSVQRRRRWAVEEKISWVHRSMEPEMTISIAAREAVVAPSQLFTWKRLYLEGGLSTSDHLSDVYLLTCAVSCLYRLELFNGH